ncbi:MAG: Asp-tRNA(Asn)/Glu-tRNA(Gln) amidotransferase subunit GatA, partial [Planctomycetes bacterium]|nr:Asp-tRNA(Asn)/Glu-tRNA(Gln) amidotransferase subunit GatA [Planctomycetota bacterium]
AVNQRIAAGENLPMAGVPILIKDNLCFKDHLTTSCSKILDGFVAPYTATAVKRLQDAGAVVIGHTNMDEFAMGSSNETSFYGQVKNPHDHERIPGGSSGGSAASVASGISPLALGSDTGGSIRQPASLCGCIGFKPTYGHVSRYGLMAFASSLDQIGPFATTVADAALCTDVMSGHDPLDSSSSKKVQASALDAVLAADTAQLKGLKIGYISEHAEQNSGESAAALEQAKKTLTDAGAELVPVSLPHEKYAVAIYYIIATGEASSNLSRYDGIHYGLRADDPELVNIYDKTRGAGFGNEVKRRIMLGTYVLSAKAFGKYYKKAMKVRKLMCNDFEKAFIECDMILDLVSPSTAFKHGERMDDPIQMYLSDVYTIATNLAGIPGISLPHSKDSNGLPIGLQLQAPQWHDEKLFSVAATLEKLFAYNY